MRVAFCKLVWLKVFEERGESLKGRGLALKLRPSEGRATIDAPYGIPSPGNDPAFQPGGKYATYFTAYATAHGAKADTTADVFGCGGTLSANPPLCAALNRHVAQLPASAQSNPAEFYRQARPTTTPSSGMRTPSTASSTASPTTTTRTSRPTSRSPTPST